MTKTVRLNAAIVIGLALSAWGIASLDAQSGKKASAPSVAGKWTMTVNAGTHDAPPMSLALEQSGSKVTGTFASPHGDMAVEGEFVDGTLKLATRAEGGDSSPITFNAKLKDDGTLAGYVSSQMGDMTWTAERAKDK